MNKNQRCGRRRRRRGDASRRDVAEEDERARQPGSRSQLSSSVRHSRVIILFVRDYDVDLSSTIRARSHSAKTGLFWLGGRMM